ncbi:MAG: TIGR03619 family F420-dependent LLM class oxidoreductase [Betaproteobacteria bacterium]|nr:TIGR03619 family F420-dependent LLM class oxidoreductase [Betaproteobacteria bacterium]
MNDVRFGLQISFTHQPLEIVAQAQLAERLGFDSIWLGEHFFRPAQLDSQYPYTPHQPLKTGEECPDSMVIAGALAMQTRRVRITTAIYLLPLRHPLQAARAIATAQALSGNRLRIGVGVGWAREEYDAFGIPFNERGARLDEGIDVLKKALAGGEFEHHGRFYDFARLTIVNKPVPMPLLVGGSTPPIFKRAARVGDAWAGTPDLTLEQCIEKRALIEGLRKEYGTAGRPFSYFMRMPKATPELVAQYAEAGFTSITVGGGQVVKWTDPLDRKLAFIEDIARQLEIPRPA